METKFILKVALISSMILSAVSIYGSPDTHQYTYKVPELSWNESFGNHRAVLRIDKPAEVVGLDYRWRRHDAAVGDTRFLIVNAATGDTISNVRRLEVTPEECKIQFGPVTEKGIYYFYYMPYHVQFETGFCNGGYLKPEDAPAVAWLAKAEKVRKVPMAQVEAVESRTQFDSFYPMEIPATMAEETEYTMADSRPFYLFAEDRMTPIRMKDAIPVKWLGQKQGTEMSGSVQPNEYYTFQVGVWNPTSVVDSLNYKITDLKGANGVIPASAVTCFNLEGIDPYGNPFTKVVDVKRGGVQPLWFGVDIAKDQAPGLYKGTLTIGDSEHESASIPVAITVDGAVLEDRGDSDPYRMTRLRWLNSTLGAADKPVAPYTAVTVSGDTLQCAHRSVAIDLATGMPKQIVSFGNDILSSPMRFIINLAGADAPLSLSSIPRVVDSTAGHATIEWDTSADGLKVSMTGTLEFDGRMDYNFTLTASGDIEVADIRLEVPVRRDIASYFLGIGLPGQDTPMSYDGKWDAPEMTVNSYGVSLGTSEQKQWLWPFDSYWIGNAHAGLHMELRGSDYTGPLLNVYRPPYPESWNNGGRGGFSIRANESEVTVTAYSGARTLKAGDSMDYEFAFLITPVKEINMRSQFTDRYFHNGPHPEPSQEEYDKGVRIINVHQGNELNPFINYPFLTVDSLKAFTDRWHEKGVKVKVYYTLRELSNAFPEIWAIRSLGDEVLRGGDGGGYNWLREHLVTDYRPQWYEHFKGETPAGVSADAAILTSEGDSRWYNYYIEGLAWMVRNMGIDGIYLDDVSFDRRILKRIRRAMEDVKPGCLIDLHSNTGFSIGAANQYAEFFPYVDKLWFGESFLYDKMTPANWLVESSGIPFGLTGDMLYRGGNPWLGMQYGMTVRYPWFTEGVNCDPTQIWKIWDDFGIDNSTMYGFWESNVPVTSSDPDVKVTVYKHPDGALLLSVGNYTDDTRNVTLNFDWEALGLDPASVVISAPAVKDMQPAATWDTTSSIEVLPRKGWLLYVTPTEN